MNNEMTMNIDNLYTETTYTDMTCGAIKVFTPVDAGGLQDPSRNTIFIAVASAMSAHGPVPINAPIEGVTSLKDAIANFRKAIDDTIESMIKQAQEMEREQRSRIITPAEAVGKGGLSIIK